MRPCLLRRALTLCLVLGAASSCRTSASPQGDGTALAIRPPLVAAEPPPDAARSKWIEKNWELRKTTLTKLGLAEVRLPAWEPPETRRNDPRPPSQRLEPEAPCKVLQDLPDAPPRLLFHPGGQFAVSADGTLHCLVIDESLALGLKKETLEGRPPSCGGGAYKETPVARHLYVLPAGVSVGGVMTVRAPYYDLDLRYEAPCPMVPSARF